MASRPGQRGHMNTTERGTFEASDGSGIARTSLRTHNVWNNLLLALLDLYFGILHSNIAILASNLMSIFLDQSPKAMVIERRRHLAVSWITSSWAYDVFAAGSACCAINDN